MDHPSFRFRKALPWVYTALFLVAAPIVIFYTAGYRYNTKKAALEKRGTLIADSTPADARIFIDDQDTGTSTPGAFQELTPGWHRVRVLKPGYAAWEKTLEIRPERVTFANGIHLWRQAPDIQLVLNGTFTEVESNPERDTLAALERGTGGTSSSRLVLLQSRGRVAAETALPSLGEGPTALDWQADSRAVLVDGPSGQDALVRLARGGAMATTTPAQGAWQGSAFIAPNGTTTWTWNSRTGTANVEPKATSTRERSGDFSLEDAPAGMVQLLFDRTFSSRAFSLPPGRWSFAEFFGNALVLRDGTRWLGVDPRQTPPFLGQAEGEAPRWLRDDEGPAHGLFAHGNELWLWALGEAPALLARQSDALVEAAWHASGDAVFFATKTQLEALELDERSGRIRQPLAAFDEIRSLDTLGKTVYVAGKRGGIDGLWAVTAE